MPWVDVSDEEQEALRCCWGHRLGGAGRLLTQDALSRVLRNQPKLDLRNVANWYTIEG